MREDSRATPGTKPGKALPMPKQTKTLILESRSTAKRRLQIYYKGERYRQEFQDFKNAVVSYFQDVHPMAQEYLDIQDYDIDTQDFIPPEMIPESYKDLQTQTVKKWIRYFYELDKMVFDLGITDIPVTKDGGSWGYLLTDQIGATEIPKSSGIDIQEENADIGFLRLLTEFQNARKALRKDRDMVGVVIGPNRRGKSTLALQLARTVEHGGNSGDLPAEAIAMDGEDFWEATQERGQYAAIMLDEVSGVFYAKDAMKGDQRKRKKRMKTAAKRNQFIVGCDTQFYQVDKEFRTDKVDFCIMVPSRGEFEFYGPNKLEKFEKDRDSGRAQTPDPDFSGGFPKLSDELWETYQEVEDEKIESKQLDSEDEDEGDKLEEYKATILDDREKYTAEYNKRRYIDRELLEAELGLSPANAKRIKKAVEAEIGLPERLD